MSKEAKTRSIDKTITVNAPVEEVWKALSEAEGITGWFAPDAKVTPGVGGKVWLSWGPGFEGTSRIEVWEPNKHMRSVELLPEPGEAPNPANPRPRAALSVDYHLEGKGGTTVLRLVHSGFGEGADWDNEFNNVTKGWGVFLSNLRFYVEQQRGKKCVHTVAMMPLPATEEDAWKRLTGPDGLVKEGKLDGLSANERYRVRTSQGDELQGVVAVVDRPNVLVLDVERPAARINLAMEKGYVFATLLSYGEGGEGLRERWNATVQAAVGAKPQGAAANA